MLIGEVAARSGVSARMLRHYDRVGLVSPSGRTHGGYRQYADADLRRLFHVEGLRALGLTLQEVAAVLADPGPDAAAVVAELVARTRERLAREQELLGRLEQVQQSGPAAWSDVLRTVGLLRELGAGSPSARQRAVVSRADPDARDAVPLARAALVEDDPNVAGAVHWALARAGDGGVAVLAEALGSSDPDRRRRAVTALVKLRTPAAMTVLAGALRHEDPVVSGRAALVCGAAGDLDAVGRLVALVVDGQDDVEAAGVLGSLADRHGRHDAVTGSLVRALAGRADVGVRRRVAGALAEVAGPAATAALTDLAGDRDRAVALTAAGVLRTRGH